MSTNILQINRITFAAYIWPNNLKKPDNHNKYGIFANK